MVARNMLVPALLLSLAYTAFAQPANIKYTVPLNFNGSCPDGHALQNHLDASGALTGTCVICPPGTATLDGFRCIPCAAGFFAFTSGMRECRPCFPGTISLTGAQACTGCAAGTFNSRVAGTVCQICPAGTISAANASSCTPCGPGTIAAASGSSACVNCNANEFTPFTAGTVCRCD
ncbi:hypothetical protein QJQ45_029918, partial [Haematococcus lacustris]